MADEKKKLFSVVLPALAASFVTLVMYIGEMILLNWHLYRFGKGFFFEAIPEIVLAPVDIVIILLSGFVTAVISHILCFKKGNTQKQYSAILCL